MSTRARKSRNRIVNLRARAHNAIAAWDDTMRPPKGASMIPPFFAAYLTDMPNYEADILWLWLDGDPEAIAKIIETLCECRGWGKQGRDKPEVVDPES